MPVTKIQSIQLLERTTEAPGNTFARDVAKGLSGKPKHIPSKYFYDENGSHLFEEIMKLEEYYPTGCEREIFDTYKDDFLSLTQGQAFQLVDLGAGDAEKTSILLKHFLGKGASFTYVPIDISSSILEELGARLEKEMPELPIKPIAADYFDALHWLGKNTALPKFVLFMGGNIGNFTKAEAAAFLSKMRSALQEGDWLLVGFDLKKDPRTILRAYDDSQGVTAEFNYNLLARMNRELGADFNISLWKHYATYDPVSGAAQSYLISQCEQEVFIRTLHQGFHFDAHEPIHTEYSMKYSLGEIDALALQTGFEIIEHFSCRRNYFIDTVWRVAK